MMYGSIRIQSSLPFDEAYTELHSKVKHIFQFHLTRTLVGIVRKNGRVWLTLAGTRRNPFKPIFWGKLLSDDNATILDGYFYIAPMSIVIHIVWFLFLGYATLCAIGSVFGLYEKHFGEPFPKVYFAVLPVFWIVSIVMLRWELKTGKEQAKCMIDRFDKILNVSL
jgi:hypothetical protein